MTKYKFNEAIENELTFDSNIFDLSSSTRDPIPVLTVSLQLGKKHRASTVAGLTCLCYSGTTDSILKKNTLNTINAR